MALYTCVDKGNESAPGFWQPLRSIQPPNSLRLNLLRIKISEPNYRLIHVHIAYTVCIFFAASEATRASEVKFDLGFELCDHNCQLQLPTNPCAYC